MDIVVNGHTLSINTNNLPDFRDTSSQVQGTDFAALLEQQKNVKTEIMEKGFTQYVSDMQQEKLEEEIREKILAALGLSEEQYNQLPAEQRAAIEQAVQEAIQEEMRLRAHEDQNDPKKSGLSVPLVAAFSGS